MIDRGSTGVRPNPPDDAMVAGFVEAFERGSTLLGDSLFGVEFFSFIRKNRLCPQLERSAAGEFEHWTLRFDYELMERWISVLCRRAALSGELEAEFSSTALWNSYDPAEPVSMTTWHVRGRRRWIGLTTLVPVETFRESLELVLQDAKSYTTDDLSQEPVVKR